LEVARKMLADLKALLTRWQIEFPETHDIKAVLSLIRGAWMPEQPRLCSTPAG
jgi:HEPN domain-containing protein